MKSKLSSSPIALNITFALIVSGLLFYKGLSYNMPAIVYFRLFVIALFAWSVIEYIIQFFSSLISRTKLGELLFWQLQGDHYLTPENKSLLFYPFPSIIIWSGIVFTTLKTFTPEEYLYTFSAMLVLCYLGMAHLHNLYHGRTTEFPLIDWMQRYHLQHHQEQRRNRYGITSPLWDLILGTLESKKIL